MLFRARLFKVIRWLFALSLFATLAIGLISYPLERTSIDPSAPKGDSDYVTVRGLPMYYFVSDPSVTHPPPVSVLVGNFISDWLAFFILFALSVLGMECIRITAFLAARLVRKIQSG